MSAVPTLSSCHYAAAAYYHSRTGADAPRMPLVVIDLDTLSCGLFTHAERGVDAVDLQPASVAVLPTILDAIASATGAAQADIHAQHLSGSGLADFNQRVQDAITFSSDEDECLSPGGHVLSYGTLCQLFNGALGNELTALSARIRTLLQRPEAAGAKLLPAGNLAGLQLLTAVFRTAYAREDNPYYDLNFPDPAYAAEASPETLVSLGWKLYENGTLQQEERCPSTVKLQLENAMGLPREIPLATRGQKPAELSAAPASEAFFIAPATVLALTVDGTARRLPLPEGACPAQGMLVRCSAVLQQGLRLRLTDVQNAQNSILLPITIE